MTSHYALDGPLAWLFLAGGRYAECVAAAERAAELARAIGDDRILLDAEVRRGTALPGLGRAEEGQRVLEGMLVLAEEVGELQCFYRALHNLGGILTAAGEFARARRYCERALEVADQTGEKLGIMFALSLLGEVLFLQGDWDAAQTHFERAVAVSRVVAWSLGSLVTREKLAQLLIARGDATAAEHCLEEGMATAATSAAPRSWPLAQRLFAECDLLEGRPEQALARLIPLLGKGNADGIDVGLLPLAARVYLECGHKAEAADLARQAGERAEARNYQVVLARAMRIQAMILIEERRWAEAEYILNEGILLTQRMPYPHAEAHLHQTWGELHLKQGELGKARDRLESALAICRRLGARKDAERVKQAIDQAG